MDVVVERPSCCLEAAAQAVDRAGEGLGLGRFRDRGGEIASDGFDLGEERAQVAPELDVRADLAIDGDEPSALPRVGG